MWQRIMRIGTNGRRVAASTVWAAARVALFGGVACGHDLTLVARHGETIVEEEFIVRQPQVDILWVLDNSSSMANDVAEMTHGIGAFVDQLVRFPVDAHLGVISTDMSTPSQRGILRTDARGERWIHSSASDLQDRFAEMVDATQSSRSNLEQGRYATSAALDLARPGGVNHGFVRFEPSASLHVVVVTDEDDATDPDQLSEERFIEEVHELKPPGRVTFHAVMPTDRWPRHSDSYERVADALGGQVLSLEGNWPSVMAQLAAAHAPGPHVEIYLSHAPLEQTLEVQLRDPGQLWVPVPLGQRAHYDPAANRVWFEPGHGPSLGAGVRLIYVRRA